MHDAPSRPCAQQCAQSAQYFSEQKYQKEKLRFMANLNLGDVRIQNSEIRIQDSEVRIQLSDIILLT